MSKLCEKRKIRFIKLLKKIGALIISEKEIDAYEKYLKEQDKKKNQKSVYQ